MSAHDNLSPAQFTHRYETYGTAAEGGGYVQREEVVHGPFYHGGRANVGVNAELTPGRKTNSWGDEGAKSSHIYFATEKETAASYARALGSQGRLYEVAPTSDNVDYDGSDGAYKTKDPLRVIRKLGKDEWD